MAFTEFLCAYGDVDPESVEKICYRKKSEAVPSGNYAFYAEDKQGTKKLSLHFRDSALGKAWRRRLFAFKACDYCPDVFASQADATLMDAWLPEHAEDPLGTSFVITRNEKILSALLSLGKNGKASLWNIEAAEVLQSQKGIIKYKQVMLPYRVYRSGQRNCLPKAANC